MCGKIFSNYSVHIPRKCIEYMYFYSCPSFPAENSRLDFLKICFPKDKTDGKKYDLLYQESIRIYEDDLEH